MFNSVSSFNWDSISNTSDESLKQTFKEEPEAKITALTQQLKNHSAHPSRNLAFKVILVLCDRTSPKLNSIVVNKFFKQLNSEHVLDCENKQGLMQSIFTMPSLFFTNPSKSDKLVKMSTVAILTKLCHKAISNGNETLAIEIAHQIFNCDSSDFTIVHKSGDLLSFAMEKGLHHLTKLFVENLSDEALFKLKVKGLLFLALRNGGDPRLLKKNNWTQKEWEEIALLLLRRGISPNFAQPTYHLVSPLSYVLEQNMSCSLALEMIFFMNDLEGRGGIAGIDYIDYISLTLGYRKSEIKLLLTALIEKGVSLKKVSRNSFNTIFSTPKLAHHLLKNHPNVFKEDPEISRRALHVAVTAPRTFSGNDYEESDFDQFLTPEFNKTVENWDQESFENLMKHLLIKKYENLAVNLLALRASSLKSLDFVFRYALEARCFEVCFKCIYLFRSIENCENPLDALAKPEELLSAFEGLTNIPGWEKNVELNFWLQRACEKIFQATFQGRTILDESFLQKAPKIIGNIKFTQLVRSSVDSLLKEIEKTNETEKEKTENPSIPTHHKLINFLAALGVHTFQTYLSEYEKKLILLFKNLASKGHLSLEQARKLARLFPEVKVKVLLTDREEREESLFVLAAASPVFCKMFHYGSDSLIRLPEPPKLFDILHKGLSKGQLDFAELDVLELEELNAIIDKYELLLPRLTNHIDELFLSKIIDLPIVLSDQKELLMNLSLFESPNLFAYIKKLPNFECLSIDIDLLNHFSNKFLKEQKALFIALLRKNEFKIKRIRLNAKDCGKLVGRYDFPRINAWIENLGANSLCDIHTFVTFFSPSSIEGFDLSGRNQLDVPLDSKALRQLVYLNLSGSIFDERQLQDYFKKAPPSLRELTMRDCSITDHGLMTIAKNCPHLTSMDLTGNKELRSFSLIDFVKRMPQLESIKISMMDEEVINQINVINPYLAISCNDKLALNQSFIEKLSLTDLIALICDDRYFLPEKIFPTFIKKLFQSLLKEENIPGTGEVIIQSLERLKNQDVLHPLISFTIPLNKNERIRFYTKLAQSLPMLDLSSYLPSSFLKKIHKQFMEDAANNLINLNEARSIANLLSRPPVPVFVKGEKNPSLLDSLVLICAGPIFRKLTRQVKAKVFSNAFIFNLIYAFLAEGKVDLKKNSLNTFMEIYKEVEKYGLPIEDFLASAKNSEIGIRLKPSNSQENLDELVTLESIVSKVTVLDITNINLNSLNLLPFVENATNLNILRLDASQRPLPEVLTKALKEKQVEIEVV